MIGIWNKVQVAGKWALPLALFTLLSLPASSQRLVVRKSTVECGRTGYQQPVTATFELRNKGLRRLVIESVRPDCGCTAVEYPKEVGAGDKFTIRMTYDARQLGHFQKMAAVRSNGSKEVVYLTMKGQVLADFQDFTGNYPVQMGALLLDKDELEYDDVNMGDTPVQEIRLMNNGTQEMTPRVMHLPSYLSAKVSPETLLPGKTGIITVTLLSDKLHGYGLTQSKVYIAQQLGEKISDDNAMGVSVTLLPDLKDFEGVNKALAPQLKTTSTEIDFSDWQGKSKKTAEVGLANVGRSTLRISSMQMYTGGLKVTLSKRELEPGESATLKIVGNAEELQQVKTRPRILMITNDPDHPKVIIRIKVK